MKTHKVLPHTADVRLWIESDSLEELFAAGLEGMAALIKESELERSKGEPIEENIKLDAPDVTSLLIDFLSAILTLSHQKNAVFTQVKFDKLTNSSLSGTAAGFETDGFDDDIKAVTYHEAEIQKNSSGNYETMIVFDI